jgi:uncharacterized protein (TIGR03083 family)
MMDLITPHRRALADALGSLSADQWRGPSMCEGWTPGHVLAHLTMPYRISETDFMAGLQACGGDFTSFSDEVARRDSAIPQAELVGILRDNAGNPWSPPGGGLIGALSHDVIHGLDVTWPLPVLHPISNRALVAVLESVTSPGSESFFGVPLEGVRFSATDLDWSRGTGRDISGRARDLLMLLAGRKVGRECFDGAPAALADIAPRS